MAQYHPKSDEGRSGSRSGYETVDVDPKPAQKGAVEEPLINDLVRATVAGSVAAKDQLLVEVHALALRYCRNRHLAGRVRLRLLGPVAPYDFVGRE